jgi:hypothetical protein
MSIVDAAQVISAACAMLMLGITLYRLKKG